MNGPSLANFEEARNLPGVLLWHASKLWQQCLNETLANLGLSSTNGAILCYVLYFHMRREPATQTTLAHATGVDLMTTSTALRTLERKGYVTRRQDPTDKRAYAVTLTTQGKNTAHQAQGLIAEAYQSFFGALPDQTDITELSTILKQLIDIHKRDA